MAALTSSVLLLLFFFLNDGHLNRLNQIESDQIYCKSTNPPLPWEKRCWHNFVIFTAIDLGLNDSGVMGNICFGRLSFFFRAPFFERL